MRARAHTHKHTHLPINTAEENTFINSFAKLIFSGSTDCEIMFNTDDRIIITKQIMDISNSTTPQRIMYILFVTSLCGNSGSLTPEEIRMFV